MKAPPPQPRALRFGIFEMDLESEEIRKNGLKLKLRGQPFHVLATIAIGDGKVITYEELQLKLWPQINIEDYKHSLGNSMLTIRKTLGDSANAPRYIQTVPRGYRFLVPITIVENCSVQNGSKNHDQDELQLEMEAIRRELLAAPPSRDLLGLLFRCETLERQHPQYSKMPDLQLLIFDIRSAHARSTALEPNWENHNISDEVASLVFKDPNAISIPLADGGWKTLGRVSESVLLVVEHTSLQGNGRIRVKAVRRATLDERRVYEQSRKQ